MHVYHYNHTERSSLERLTRGTETESLFAYAGRDRALRGPLRGGEERPSGRHRVLRTEVARAPHRIRASRRYRTRRRRGRRLRPLHDDEGSGAARGDRALQRGRRRGDHGACATGSSSDGRADIDVARRGARRARRVARHRRTGGAPEELRRAQPRTPVGRPLELLASRTPSPTPNRSSPKRRRSSSTLYGDPDFIANLTFPRIRGRRQSRRAGERRASTRGPNNR